MEYIYASLLLNATKQQINEANIKRVLEAANVKADESRVKALVAALEGVNIDEAIKEAVVPVAAAPASVGEDKAAKKEKPKEEKKSEEQAAAGLAGLFG